MATFRQASFTGGEVAASLHARVDLAKYHTCVRNCENWIVLQQGGVTTRPGTRFVAAVKDSARKTRLVPFVFSGAQTYVLEVGHQYIRFHTAGAPILNSSPAWAASTHYVAGQQVLNDTGPVKVYVCITEGTSASSGGPTGTGGDITDGEAHWAYVSASGGPLEVPTTYLEAELPALRFAQSADVLTIVHPSHAPAELRRYDLGAPWGIEWRLVAWAVQRTIEPPDGIEFGVAGLADETHPAKDWKWVVTAVAEDGQESLPSDPVGHGSSVPVYSDRMIEVRWQPVPGAKTYNVYRGMNGIHGFVGSADASHTKTGTSSPAWLPNHYYHKSIAYRPPDYVTNDGTKRYMCIVSGTSASSGGPTGTGEDIVDGTAHWKYVGSSGVLAYFTDDVGSPAYSDTPPSGKDPFPDASDYPSLVTYHQQRLVFGGSTGHPQTIQMSKTGAFKNFDAAIPANDDDSIEFTLSSPRLDELRGLVSCKVLLAFTAGTEYVITGGSVNEIITPTSIDPRAQSNHGAAALDPLEVAGLVLYVQRQGATVRELMYQIAARPEGDVYGGLDLSVLAPHLFDSHSIVSWAYAAVPFRIVWAVREDGVLLALTYLKEQEVAGWHHHTTQGTFESVTVVPESGEDAVYVVVARTVGGNTVRYVERFASRLISAVADGCFLDSALSYSGAPQTVFSGLGHLEGKTVGILADGIPQAAQVVTSGTITLGMAASKVHVGLVYTPEVETLNLAIQQADIRTKRKVVTKVSIEVASTGGLWLGEPGGEMFETPAGEEQDVSPTPKVSDLIDVKPESAWNTGGRIVIQQRSPLPATILGLHPEVEFGG